MKARVRVLSSGSKATKLGDELVETSWRRQAFPLGYRDSWALGKGFEAGEEAGQCGGCLGLHV